MPGTQLLIELPVVLKGAVLFNVNNRQDEVFLKLLQNVQLNQNIEEYRDMLSFVENWHKTHRRHPFMNDNGCGCEYCTKTREYANLKLSVHKLRSKLDDYYPIYPTITYQSELAYLTKLETRLSKLIEERKEMRTHLGFISKRVLKDI